MRTENYQVEAIVSLLNKEKIATMKQLKTALGTKVDVTVFRKLEKIHYHTSYSHHGKFYALDDIADFDENGLWSFKSVRFSRYGTLINTAETFVNDSEAGYFIRELEKRLHVGVKEPLLKLVRQHRLYREKVYGQYLYFSSDATIRKHQLLFRKSSRSESLFENLLWRADVSSDELRAAIILFFSLLDEKQRRLYAGLEALKLGHGGDRKIAGLLNLDVATVAKGRKQLHQRDFETGRIRKEGAGRKSTEKKRPE